MTNAVFEELYFKPDFGKKQFQFVISWIQIFDWSIPFVLVQKTKINSNIIFNWKLNVERGG